MGWNFVLRLEVTILLTIKFIRASSFMYTRQPKNGMSEATKNMHEAEAKALETKQQNFSFILPS